VIFGGIGGSGLLLSPMLYSIETVYAPTLADTRSDRPSPSRSPMATQWGFPDAAKSILGTNVPSPSPGRTETPLVLVLATARSVYPSPVRSPVATEVGL
jgi:hypothetical protein